MADPQDIASRILSALRLSEPNLDTTIGTPARKVIDAVASSISDYTVDGYLMDRQNDVDSKVAGDLDDFCSYWGISRLPAQRANGVVTFTRGAAVAATKATLVPIGTQIISYSSPPIYLQTVASATMSIGQTSIDVPVQSLVPGPQGNLPANSVSAVTTSLDGISAVSNPNPITGGIPEESDDQLRSRFKSTFFRNMAGTDSMYRATALQVPANSTDPTSRAVSQVSILGSSTVATEQMQLSASGTATTSLGRAAYIYPFSLFVQSEEGEYLTPDQDYTYSISNSGAGASISIDATNDYANEIVQIEYRYISNYSRNDPAGTRFNAGTINNRVDIWVNGVVAQSATQSVVFISSRKFNDDADSATKRDLFVTEKGLTPSVNDVYVQLAYSPLISVPDSLTINGAQFVRNTDYNIVYRTDAMGRISNNYAGLIFYNSTSLPPNRTSFTMDYTFNAVPDMIQSSIENWIMLGTDVQVHAGVPVPLRFNFAVVYERNYQPSAVNTVIDNVLSTYVQGKGFASDVLISDVIEEAKNVPGVKNIRFLTQSDDGVHYGIEAIYPQGNSVFNSSGKIIDASFADNSYPVYDSSRIVVRAQNTFGSVS